MNSINSICLSTIFLLPTKIIMKQMQIFNLFIKLHADVLNIKAVNSR